MLQPQHITEYYIQNHINPGDIAIDATMGNGNDTLKLCKAVGDTGRVYAFDIQQSAIDSTGKKLSEENISNAELILDSHIFMDKYVNEKVSCVLFNLGYLPGGDHSICTKSDTSIEAIEKSLSLISEKGFVSVTVYYGKNSGTEEKEAVMEYLKTLDHKKYTVVTHDFFNRPNNPPITVIITKN
ncbi:MAG: SAM-dependent methyltransferase [Clostridia bacterium]|nr:SAM-dependent methyltransferase [Clostridia bacterium]